jgi:hypothetical protein
MHSDGLETEDEPMQGKDSNVIDDVPATFEGRVGIRSGRARFTPLD